MDKEMIVTALRCRKSGGDSNHLCAQCRYSYAIYCDIYELFGDAADLIEAQAAEVERMTAAYNAAVADINQDCTHCNYAVENGACRLLPEGDQFSPDYTEGFDRDGNCEHWQWRGPQGAGEGGNG